MQNHAEEQRFHDGVGETSAERAAAYLPKYLVVVIDPETGNQADFEFDVTHAWITPIVNSCAPVLAQAMKRLKQRRDLANRSAG